MKNFFEHYKLFFFVVLLMPNKLLNYFAGHLKCGQGSFFLSLYLFSKLKKKRNSDGAKLDHDSMMKHI